MADFKPELEEGLALPAGSRIDTSHKDYVALEGLAREEGWTQKSFTRVLSLEARRAIAAQERAKATAPTPAAAPADYSKMSTSEKIARALAASDAKRAAGEK